MAATVTELFNEAFGLDAPDRATLAGLLLESLGPAQRAATNVAYAVERRESQFNPLG
jgi:hypothetical protein